MLVDKGAKVNALAEVNVCKQEGESLQCTDDEVFCVWNRSIGHLFTRHVNTRLHWMW